MMSLKKKIISGILVAVMAAVSSSSFIGCTGKQNENKIEYWSTYNTKKINKDLHDYDNVKASAEINLTMAQGEYEGAQIIFTPEKDVKEYTVSVGDLTNTVTGEVFSKNRVRVYKQEYIYLSSVFSTMDGARPGYYPDALIPIEAVVEYKENSVSAGENQGIYFRFSTRPELDENGLAVVKDETKTKDSERFNYVTPGTYKGKAEIITDGTTKEIPITLMIVNATVSETNHLKTDFDVYKDALPATLNYSQEGFDSYTDLMLEYRMSNMSLFCDFVVSEAVLTSYVDKVVSYLKNPRYTNITLPASNTTYAANFGTEQEVADGKVAFTKESFLKAFDADSEYYVRSFYNPDKALDYRSKFVSTDSVGNEYAYDETLANVYAGNMMYMKRMVWCILEHCLKDGVNYLEKCQYEFNQIDEPWQHNAHDAVRSTLSLMRASIIQLAEKIATEEKPSMTVNGKVIELDFSQSLLTREEIVQSVLDFKAIVTADYNENFEGIIEKWCPTVDRYGTEYVRTVYYGDQKEKWWYTVDHAPGPSFETEISLLYGRVTGWQMADYNIDGLLYWGGAVFGSEIEEYFKTNYFRYPNINGDGYLIYPGGQYGLDEAIPSLRLEAVRDGFEEYELFYNIKGIYSEISKKTGIEFDASKIIQSIGKSLYVNEKIFSDDKVFAQARTSLLQLATCAESSANMCIMDYEDNGYGKFTFKIYANDGAKLYNGNEEITNVVQSINGGKIYGFEIELKNESNLLDLRCVIGGEEYNYVQNLGGKVVTYNVGEIKMSDFAKTTEMSFVATEVDCESEGVYTSVGGKAIKIVAGPSKEPKEADKLQYFKFDCKSFKDEFAKAKSITLHLYNASDEDINLIIEYKKNKSDMLNTLLKTTLEEGKEVSLVLTLPETGADDYLEYFDFCVGEKNSATTEKTLYIKDMVIYE